MEIAAITLLLSLLQIPEFAFQDLRVLVSFSRFLKSGWLFQIAACSILIWPRSANALVGGAFDAIFKAALSTSTSLWSCFLFDRQIVDLRISERVSRRKTSQGFRKNIAVQLLKGDSDNETLYPTETCLVFVVLLFRIKLPLLRSERK